MIRATYIELLFIISSLIMTGVYSIGYDLRFLVSALILMAFPILYETLLKISEIQNELNEV